ncbi:dTDP-4-dehydrorhamnose reductase [uncultured Prochlorococcus sp.]|uniref:dTDP-4-dehydrorhamnose reductase n=1 Tax=uncultured Prochlorococcus sp. TaxID=159733 RepID=UPI002583DE99|nr:dTDP-4-dehydrorhamnose reductase [uncultured Prochlorococcus sp.]
MKILLLGSKGQLGSKLKNSLKKVGEVIESDRSRLNLENLDQILPFIEKIKPSIIINASAYTNVEAAEDQAELASIVNFKAVDTLAKIAKKLNILFIHFSTDYVFDGTKNDPYLEDDLPSPLNVYGKTKLDGEKAIQESGCMFYIFRVTWVIGEYGNNFAKKIIQLAKERSHLKIISDQQGVPTSPSLISEVLIHLIKSYKSSTKWGFGIYNLTPNGKASWFIIAELIIRFMSEKENQSSVKAITLEPVLTSEFITKAKRPLNSLLDNSKLEKALGYQLNDWKIYFLDDMKRILNKNLK